MNIWKVLTTEKCPHCNKAMKAEQNHWNNTVVKSCPDEHFKKEIHPYVESTIEYSIK